MNKIKPFRQVLSESIEKSSFEELYEALLTFGGKAYPKFGQVIILSGGAGSGKGFIKSNLLGAEGIVLDVDRLKELVMASTKFNATIKSKYGVDVSDMDLRTPEDVSKLHDVVSGLKINDRKIKAIFTSIIETDPTRKPNLIFDITLKDMTKFYNIMRQVEDMGYWKKNIHLVWVLNTLEVAMEQNKTRDRIVPEEILLATHQGASYSMSEIIKMGSKLQEYMDGEIYIAFNQKDVDIKLDKKPETEINPDAFRKKKMVTEPKYILKGADYVQVKEQGKKPMKISELESRVIDKIRDYVPNAGEIW